MEAETQNPNPDLDTLSSDDVVLSSDSLTPPTIGKPGKKKGKKKKKSEGGSDIAFFACFPCMVIAAVTAILTLVGFIPNMYFAELFASLRAQFVVILLICTLPALFAPQLRIPMLVGCGLFMLINLVFVAPAMIPKAPLSKDQEGLAFVNFRVLQLSIEDPTAKLEPVIETVNQSKADVVCVTGIPQRSLIKLNEMIPPHYLNRAFFIRDDGYAQAIYSTVLLKGTTQKKVGPDKLPVICTTIHFDYGWFRVIMVKLPEPTDDATLAKRNEQLAAVEKVVKSLNGRKIILGNFNMTPYSMSFGSFLKETELSDSRIGVQPNWNIGPVDFLGLLHVPADHILINKSVGVLHRYVMPTEGLTHQPLVADLYPGDREAVLYKDEPTAEEAAPPAATKPAAQEEAPAVEDKKPTKRKKRSK